MRGIGSGFSRLPKVAAWLAGAAILAGTMSPRAFAQADETAMAIPRLAPFDGESVALPRPLAAPDAAVLARLFASPRLDTPGLLRAAEALDPTVKLNDEMLGHVLAARYLGPNYHSSAAELSAWLARYASLPGAVAIGGLLRRRAPYAALPAGLVLDTTLPSAAVPEEADPPGRSVARNPLLDSTVHQRIHAGQFESALRLVAHTKGLHADYGALLRAEIAQGMFTHNQDQDALALARVAAQASGGRIGLADYVAGLAAWRLNLRSEATVHFASAAKAAVATPSQLAAAAFWAGRGCLALGNRAYYRGWMLTAGAQRRTFYGQLARRLTGSSDGLAFEHETLGEADIDAVAAEPAGLRAFALLQLDQTGAAEAELRQLAAGIGQRPGLSRAVMLIAERVGFYDLAADLAAAMQQQGASALDSDRFPVPRLRPGHGFLMDPALVYALTRIESNFDPQAVSAMGAQGLMQLMPETAGFVSSSGRALHLHDPATNLDLGQRYVAYLAEHDIVDGDLLRLLVSYNSGPAAFGRWADDIRDTGDPLLFIEAIPTDETRAFVQRALAYTWIYAARLHLPAPSLDALAHGKFPRFSSPKPITQAILH